MKKILLFIGIIFISASASFAQKSIGLRLGSYGILYQLLTSEFSLMNNEITYQQPIDNDRLEIDFGMHWCEVGCTFPVRKHEMHQTRTLRDDTPPHNTR